MFDMPFQILLECPIFVILRDHYITPLLSNLLLPYSLKTLLFLFKDNDPKIVLGVAKSF